MLITAMNPIKPHPHQAPMIITLSINLMAGMYAQEDWRCELEVAENMPLDELHNAIQDAVAFDNDHLFSFFKAREAIGSTRILLDEDSYLEDITLSTLFPLPKGYKLFYWFDFGDDWIFQITKSRKKAKAAQPKRQYPFMITTTGHPPEQYPSHDDEDEDGSYT